MVLKENWKLTAAQASWRELSLRQLAKAGDPVHLLIATRWKRGRSPCLWVLGGDIPPEADRLHRRLRKRGGHPD